MTNGRCIVLSGCICLTGLPCIVHRPGDGGPNGLYDAKCAGGYAGHPRLGGSERGGLE